jgi:hypothetical protein
MSDQPSTSISVSVTRPSISEATRQVSLRSPGNMPIS